MAFLEFLAAAARAEIVAANFRCLALNGFWARFVVLVRVQLLRPAVGAGHRSEQLFDFLRT